MKRLLTLVAVLLFSVCATNQAEAGSINLLAQMPDLIVAAEDADPDAAPATMGDVLDAKFVTDNLWILLAAFLVFIMHLGFATLESGLTQGKNTVNILFKNLMIVCIGLLTYALCGFNLMYPGFEGGVFGFAGWGLTPYSDSPDVASRAYADYTYWP